MGKILERKQVQHEMFQINYIKVYMCMCEFFWVQ